MSRVRTLGPRIVTRAAWIGLAASCGATLVLARDLTPDPRGLGTHLALGLPPCGFLAWFGLPCPTCGLTTAFAHLARFELAQSIVANPMGLPLFGLTCACVPLALHAALRAEPIAAAVDRLRADRWALGLVIALLLSWSARLAALLTR